MNEDGEQSAPKRKRRTKAEIEAAKLEAEMESLGTKMDKAAGKTKAGGKQQELTGETMYTLKFNSPILPYAKFPLTQNKYIQDFWRSYEEDKDKIDRVIGVHFEKNSN